MRADLSLPFSRRAERGSVVVELSIVCMVMAIMLVMTFGLGRYFWAYNRLVAAVYAGGRYLSAGPWTDTRLADAKQLIRDRVKEDLGTAVAASVVITCTCPDVSCDDPSSTLSKLKVTYNFPDPLHVVFGTDVPIQVKLAVPNAH